MNASNAERRTNERGIVTTGQHRPMRNPMVVLREDKDEWAVLLDPDTGSTFGLSPVALFIWKRLDGQHAPADILSELQENVKDLPDEAAAHVRDFIEELARKGLTTCEAG